MATDPTTVLAVDFGATSIRVVAVDVAAPAPTPRVVHRAANVMVTDAAGHRRWDWSGLMAELDAGLDRAVAEHGPIASIGVDTWGVDYGLLDGRGRLLSPPFSYRDHRTDGYREVVDRIGAAALYARTGLQLEPFSTIFQLAAHEHDELDRARHLLLLPELVVHHLTGAVVGERTSAGTTGLVDLDTGTWSPELLDAIGVPPSIFSAILPATTAVGTWRGVPVHLVGGHDTASAVAVTAGGEFAATGTWLLVGREQPQPDRSEEARTHNLTNEPGVLGGTRLLRNVAGFWLLESCRPAWGNPTMEALCEEAARLDVGDGSAPPFTTFDATAERFLAPDDMVGEVTDALGLAPAAEPALVARGVVESLAATAAAVLDHIPPTGDRRASAVTAVGGGVQVPLLLDRLRAHLDRPLGVGPVEAAALGNAMVQGIALGRWTDLDDARRWSAGALPVAAP